MPDDNDTETSALRGASRLSTSSDYEAALSKLAPYLVKPPAPGTVAASLFYALVGRIAVYEDEHFPLENNLGMMHVH